MDAAITHLNKVLSELDELADHLERAGFEAQSDTLDAAAEKVEDVRTALETLATFGAGHRRARRAEAAHA